LFHLHYRRLVSLAAPLVDDLETAEDVVHDAFGDLYRHRRELRDRHAATAYLDASVVERARSKLRPERTHGSPHAGEPGDAVDGVSAARRLEAELDAIDRGRGRRGRGTAIAAVAAVVAVALVVTAIVLVGRPGHNGVDGRTGRRRPAVAGGLLVKRSPFLPDWFVSGWHVAQQADAKVPRLTHCVDDLHSWGALYVQGVTYVDLRPAARRGLPARRVNEWL